MLRVAIIVFAFNVLGTSWVGWSLKAWLLIASRRAFYAFISLEKSVGWLNRLDTFVKLNEESIELQGNIWTHAKKSYWSTLTKDTLLPHPKRKISHI